MQRQRYIVVPHNIKAMKNYDLGQDKSDEMIEWKLNEQEFEILYNNQVFHKLNEVCNTILDDFESEVINIEELSNAEIATGFPAE